MSIRGKVAAEIAYALGLRGFLRDTISVDNAQRMLAERLTRQSDNFLDLLQRAVYPFPKNPYARLLRHAGIELSDVRALVRDFGLEGALGRLHDAGVYVTQDEFKGKRPIRRNQLEVRVTADDFNNPLARAAYSTRTSGSRGPSSRAPIDFDYIRDESLYYAILPAIHGLGERPWALWWIGVPTFPLLLTKVGHPTAKNFCTVPFSWNPESVRLALFNAFTYGSARLYGHKMAAPQFVPRSEVLTVVRWLAEQTARGAPAIVICMTSPAIRICLAAQESGLDISGTVFRLGGEPYTRAKAEIVEGAGARALVAYSMAEMGSIGHACATPMGLDDMHFCSDKLTAIERETAESAKAGVEALIYTKTLATGPKLFINVDSGDYAIMETRDCGCLLGELGFTTHISSIASYEKLTSEGVTFLGGRLYELLEETLPARFGGGPMDYQIVEEEEGGLPRVSLIVSPRVGNVDEQSVLDTVLDELRRGHRGGRVMAGEWQQSGTLRVVRREPYETRTAKVLPLHVRRPAPPTPVD